MGLGVLGLGLFGKKGPGPVVKFAGRANFNVFNKLLGSLGN